MVGEDFLDEFLGRLLVSLWQLLEGLVGWCEDGVVGCGAVQCLDQVWVLIDELCQFGCVLAASNELVDGLVWGMMPVSVVGSLVMWWTMVRRLVVRVVKDIDILNGRYGRINPGLCVKLHHRVMAFESRLCLLSDLRGSVDGIVDGILGERTGIFECLFNAGPNGIDIS